MKIGVLGGTFNPPHTGHRILIENALNVVNFDKILIIPTFIPPHKTCYDIVQPYDRINMCRLAFSDIKNAQISTVEIDRGGKSYTYDTLCALKEQYPDAQFYFIMGSDMTNSFKQWYRYEDILSLCKICACKRYESDNSENPFEEYSDRIIFCDGEPFEISSTEIRERIKNGQDVSRYLDKDVYQYILTRKLYSK